MLAEKQLRGKETKQIVGDLEFVKNGFRYDVVCKSDAEAGTDKLDV